MGNSRKMEPFYWNKGIFHLHLSDDQCRNKLKEDYAYSIQWDFQTSVLNNKKSWYKFQNNIFCAYPSLLF